MRIRIHARNKQGTIRTDFGARFGWVGRDCVICGRQFRGRAEATPQFHWCATCVAAALIAEDIVRDARVANGGGGFIPRRPA